jgi:hypothetical protein
MSHSSSAITPTAHASKYMQQVCKHWAHNLEVTVDQNTGTVRFPKDARGAEWPGDAVVTFTAQEDALVSRIDASDPGQLEGLKGAVARHLDRFAFREAPLAFGWHDA